MFSKQILGVLFAACASAVMGGIGNACTVLLPTSDVQLAVNTVTGDVNLFTTVAGGLPIADYEIDTASGSLVPANLRSIRSVDPSFFPFDAKTTQLSESSFSTYTLNPSFDLGNIFNVNGTRDLTFIWGDTNSNTYSNAPVDNASFPLLCPDTRLAGAGWGGWPDHDGRIGDSPSDSGGKPAINRDKIFSPPHAPGPSGYSFRRRGWRE